MEVQPVVDNEGNYIINDQGMLVWDVNKKTLMYVQREVCEARATNDSIVEDNSSVIDPKSDVASICCTSTSATEETRNPWSRADVEKLIELYNEHQPLFKSTTTRNEKVWCMIATKLKNHTAEQCKNKFAYLKAKYVKRKDNMSTKATGASKITFAYFDAMDKIFGTEPNVRPPVIASSLAPIKVPLIRNTEADDELSATEEVEDTNVTQNKPANTKAKTRSNEDKLARITELFNQNQQAAQRRHDENMKKKDEAINAMKELLTILKDSK